MLTQESLNSLRDMLSLDDLDLNIHDFNEEVMKLGFGDDSETLPPKKALISAMLLLELETNRTSKDIVSEILSVKDTFVLIDNLIKNYTKLRMIDISDESD